MKIVQVKRNNMGLLWSVVIIAIFAIILLPTKTVTYEVSQDIIGTEEVVREVPVEMTGQSNTTKTVIQEVTELVEINYRIDAFENIESIMRSGKRYAEQAFKIELDDLVDGCFAYQYEFFQKSNIANTEQSEACFSNTRMNIIELQELYVGDIDDFSFRVILLETPTMNVTTISNVTVIVPEDVTETVYVNKTVEINVTTRGMVEETKRVNWLFGFEIF